MPLSPERAEELERLRRRDETRVDGYVDNFLDYCASGGLIADGALAVPMVQDALTDLADTYDPEE